MVIKPIRTARDYKGALRAIAPYFDVEPARGSAESDHFEILATLIEAYEAKHYPIDLPDPVEAIEFRMAQGGLTPKDLVPAIGRLNRVYEVLNRKRALTLPMIWKLHELFGIPTDSLIRPVKLAA